ncbi:MAG TPA: MFS transporter [Gaiellaceae bacterium]|nr:MFS transporter [Gaiellaceae bacterium]
MQALRDRNFRLVFSARTISFVGTNLAPIAVSFAVLSVGGGATAIGLSFAAWTLAQISTLAFAGVVADRVPRRVVMVVSDSANTGVRTVMGVLLVTGHAHVWELVALQACGGAAVAFYSPASYGLIRETVPTELLQQANGYLAIARYLAFPLGAAVGGTIVALVGAGWALLFDAATYATSALLLVRVHVAARAAAATAGFLRELREGWSAFTEHAWIWISTTWISLYFLLTYAPFFVLGPYVAKQSLGGAGAWGAVVTGEGIGSLAGGLLALRVKPPRRALATVIFLFAGAAVQSVLLAFRTPVEALAPAAVLAGFAFAYGSVIWDTAMQRTVPPEKIARVSAYSWLAAMVFLPLGYAVAGPVAMAVGLKTALLAGAGWVVVSTAFVSRLPSIRDFDYEAPPASAVTVPAG